MRRERRRFDNDNLDFQRVLYIAGGILSLAVIAFIAVFILYGSGTQEESQIGRHNTSSLDDYVANVENVVEETSSQMGKTVNEMAGENTTINTNTNSIKNENESVIEKENDNSKNNNEEKDNTKYAINTSKIESNKQENKTEENNQTQKKDEEIKDPEFKMPVEGEILREYAKENLVYSPTLDEWITHNGLDIAAAKTTVVKASADGTVKSIKNDPRYGLTVVIEHTNGFSSVYSNLLTAEFVEEGEKVEQGQTIGTVGNTATFEIADEPHLHFEILKENQNLDPQLYIK